jgi:EEF1A lysine methyltransferase 4
MMDIILLKLMSQYGRAEYWEERYSRDPAAFDWYQRYFTLRDLIGANIPIEFRILNVGSGNSSIPASS